MHTRYVVFNGIQKHSMDSFFFVLLVYANANAYECEQMQMMR